MKAHPWRFCSRVSTNTRGNDLVPPRRTFPWPTSNGSSHCCAENGFRKISPQLHPLHQRLPRRCSTRSPSANWKHCASLRLGGPHMKPPPCPPFTLHPHNPISNFHQHTPTS